MYSIPDTIVYQVTEKERQREMYNIQDTVVYQVNRERETERNV